MYDLSLLVLVGKSTYVTRPKLNDYFITRNELLQRINEIFPWVKLEGNWIEYILVKNLNIVL